MSFKCKAGTPKANWENGSGQETYLVGFEKGLEEADCRYRCTLMSFVKLHRSVFSSLSLN